MGGKMKITTQDFRRSMVDHSTTSLKPHQPKGNIMFNRSDFMDFIAFIGFLSVLFIAAMVLGILLKFIATEIDVNTMQQAGYSAKRINLDCVAEYKGRWLDCDAVLRNQVQITN